MWILYAFGSAFFAGATSILAKIGVKDIDSHVATAIRTIVVLIFSWIMVFIVGSQGTIGNISGKTLTFLILSGFATGASWLCYFKALQLGDVNKVVPIDKSSIILTMVLAFIFLGENITINMVVGMIGIGIGTYLMIQKKESIEKVVKGKAWLVYALLSAIFASLTSILGKVGIENVESNLGTAIRTIVVLIMAWIIVFATKKQSDVKKIDKKSLLFLILSGIATGASWLCYYKALQDGLASIVVPIDKLSILVTILFAYVFLKEKLSKKSIVGLVLIVVGTLILLIKI
ncbi:MULTISPECIES: EamA family transporter [Clostridium]|uniref:EamA family transporter n=1 Tax=Clostridium TaxID=1485 RepID=UPI0006C29BC4|nr:MULTISPECIES: EamA family transporter [Clostridium]MBX9183626.1 EamA family transporter [Clostridium sp. K04]MDU3520920.1 EamA family transporter [Clostridium saudiense]CUN89142.1 DMT family permease [Clostridium disporicum]SCI95205.1 aromatic amino acid exporter [uncultured Clostridium sp.]